MILKTVYRIEIREVEGNKIVIVVSSCKSTLFSKLVMQAESESLSDSEDLGASHYK